MEKDIKSIISVDAYNKVSYSLQDNKLKEEHKLSFNKKNFVTSFIANKEIITTNISISRSIPEEDIEDIINIKVYEELNLDQAAEYNIQYVESKTPESEERTFSVFIINSEKIEEVFSELNEKTKYIDLIIPEPLLYKVLYTKEILNNRENDLFIYFTDSDATIAFYKEGEFIYSKSISYSIEDIYSKYCERLGEAVKKKEFLKQLQNEGLKSTNEDFKKHITGVFGQLFVSINDIIIYIKRAFEIENINNLYIGTSLGKILGLDDFSSNYVGVPYKEFDFNYKIESDFYYVDQYQYLMLLNSIQYLEDSESILNLTEFPRPPKFQNRASGQFIIAMTVSLSLAISYPLYFLINLYIDEAKIYSLDIQNQELTKEATIYKGKIQLKSDEFKKISEEKDELLTVYSNKKKTLDSIYDKKVNYKLKSGIMYSLSEDINEFGVKVKDIKSIRDKFEIEIISMDDKKITSLIKFISKKYFKDIKMIDIKSLEKVETSNYYSGILEVKL